MSVELQDIRAAAERIAPYAVKTPLIRMRNLEKYLGCEVYAKCENMQVTGAFKFRGAVNRALMLSKEDLDKGIVTASSGNHGKAIAYVAKMLGAKAAVVMPYTAPSIKVEAIKALGAEVIQCETAVRFELAAKICEERGATMIPPFNDDGVMAGQGTIGLEIMEQCPELTKVIVPVSGGGLIGGISTAVKALSPQTEVIGAEPAALPRYSASLAAGKPVTVEQKKTLADALVSGTPGSHCFPVVAAHVDRFADVSDEYMLKGMKLLLTEGKLLAEPSSCIGIGAVLEGLIKVKPEDKVCFIISGGSVGLGQLKILEEVTL